VLALVCAAALVAAGGASTARADQSYTDPRGDAGSGSDIVAVTVRNDAAGNLTIQVGLASPLPDNHFIWIDVDQDKNASTGLVRSGAGIDWRAYGGKIYGAHAFRWNGSAFAEVTPPAFGTSGTVVEFRINRAELGNTSGFHLAIFSGSGDVGSAGGEIKFWDTAGYYTYNVATTPTAQCSNGLDDDGDGKIDTADPGCSSPSDTSEADSTTPPGSKTLLITSLTRSPARPTAGETFAITATVNRKGMAGAPSWSLYCEAKLAGKKLRQFGSPAPPRPSCLWSIPDNAAGKRLAVKMQLTEQGVTTTRGFVTTVATRTVQLVRVGSINVSPLKGPVAGQDFFYAIGVAVRSGTQEPRRISAGSVQCIGVVGNRPVPVIRQYSQIRPLSGARCAWKIPPGTRGQAFRGTMVVRSAGATLRWQTATYAVS
jgi:hypothetical protein